MKIKKGKLQDILSFIQFTHKFQQVKRTIFVTGEDRNENDAEHSFQLALVAWYVIENEKLNLDKGKVIKYALAHDLVEIYAGDTYFYTSDQTLKDSQKAREKEASKTIKKDFPEFRELHKTIKNYESKADSEAKFVYALDKILPALNVFLDNGRSWQRDKVTYEMLRTKDAKIAVSTEAVSIWTEYVQLLEKNIHLFAKQRDCSFAKQRSSASFTQK